MFISTNSNKYSEYGCNRVMPRDFDEVQALYGPDMRALSGGLVYEYSQESANYGLVQINEDGSVKLLADYDNLQAQFNKLNMSALESANPQSTSIKAPDCSASLISAPDFSKNFTIPAVCPGCQDLINNGIQNPQRGAFVNVNDKQVSQKVYGSNGEQVDGLTLNVVSNDGSNTPGGDSTTPSSTASSSSKPSQTGNEASPSQTTQGSASQVGGSCLLALLSVFAFALFL